MSYRKTPFVNEGFYHIYNRGVNKQNIFVNSNNYYRFLETLNYYQFTGPKPKLSTHRRFRAKDYSKNPKLVEIICFCLMPNHFHLLIKQIKEGGVTEFMSKISNSYTKYYNIKHKRTGYLLTGEFKAKYIETDEQLLHLSRYIHLNPFVANLTSDLQTYSYSSYPDFIGQVTPFSDIISNESIIKFFRSNKECEKFTSDHQDYALKLEKIKHLIIKEE